MKYSKICTYVYMSVTNKSSSRESHLPCTEFVSDGQITFFRFCVVVFSAPQQKEKNSQDMQDWTEFSSKFTLKVNQREFNLSFSREFS